MNTRPTVFWIKIVLALLAALVLGWGLGSWSACRDRPCSFDVNLFEAVGTWVGGLGTGIAAGVAAFELRARRVKNRVERQNEIATLKAVAQSCAVRARPTSESSGQYAYVQVEFANRTPYFVRNVVWRDSADAILAEADLVTPGGEPFGQKFPIARFGISAPLRGPKADATAVVRRDVEATMIFEYTIEGLRFRRQGSDVQLAP